MAISLKAGRVSLMICSLLLVLVALVVVLVVIPSVKADTSPEAVPQRAAAGFWVSVVLQLLASAVFLMEAMRTRGRTLLSMIGLTGFCMVVLLIGYALADAAAACLGHGPQMHATAIVLFACAAVACLSALIGISAAYMIPKKA